MPIHSLVYFQIIIKHLYHTWASGHNSIKAGMTFVLTESESEVAQSCPTLCDPMDCSLVGCSPWGRTESDMTEAT